MSPGRAPAIAALAEITARATRSASGSVATTLLVECARGGQADGSLGEATRAVQMLEGAIRLHDDLLETRPGSSGNGDRGPVGAGLGGAWLLGRAGEAISGLGDEAAAMWGEAANGLVRARTLAFEDLYDAGRTPMRYLAVAEIGSGSLHSLAARLGGSLSGAEEPAAAALGEYGRELGVAAKIRDDVVGLRDPDGPAARRVGAGDYPLPLLYAIESAPELAGLLGKPLDAEALTPVLEGMRAAGGVERATEECRRHALAAAGALDGLPDVDAVIELAERTPPNPVEAPE